MVSRNIPECDVFGTYKDVKPVKITVETEDDEPVVLTKDLSPRAYKRLRGLIWKGTRPPAPRKKGGADDA